jgi:hypothetical protein
MAPQGGSGQSGISTGFVSFIPYVVILVIILLGIYLFSKKKSKNPPPNEGLTTSEKSESINFNVLSIQKKYIIIAAVIGIIAAFLPQFTINGTSIGSISAFYIFFRFIIFAIPIFLCLRDDKTKNLKGGKFYFAIIPPALMAVSMLVTVGGGNDEHDKVFSYQFGYYLVMLATIAIPIIGFLYKNKE